MINMDNDRRRFSAPLNFFLLMMMALELGNNYLSQVIMPMSVIRFQKRKIATKFPCGKALALL
jgi:hypothetical protein